MMLKRILSTPIVWILISISAVAITIFFFIHKLIVLFGFDEDMGLQPEDMK